jgi:hypothetical protein
LLALPALGAAKGGGQRHGHAHGHGHGKPSAGARSLGDPLLPQIGNGGYDVKRYRIGLDYDPVANEFKSAKTTIRLPSR